jgi:hypothetical protein
MGTQQVATALRFHPNKGIIAVPYAGSERNRETTL